jgi:peroxiredoxin Q/BCP
VESHKKFKDKYSLPFTLLADPDHQVCEAYGVWGLKKSYGREYEGVYRTTFIIGPEGKIQRVFENVKPSDHSQEVLRELGK